MNKIPPAVEKKQTNDLDTVVKNYLLNIRNKTPQKNKKLIKEALSNPNDWKPIENFYFNQRKVLENKNTDPDEHLARLEIMKEINKRLQKVIRDSMKAVKNYQTP
jgi:hypothetical protein